MLIRLLPLVLIVLIASLFSDRYAWKPGQQLVGEIGVYAMTPDDSLRDIAKANRVGYDALIAANPGNARLPTASSYVLIIPKYHILPDIKPGININLAERRLYYLDENAQMLYTYPVSIGRVGWTTPQGEFSIMEKMYRPYWHIPESIRSAEAKRGVVLPKRIPPGKENPLGEYAVRLSSPTYLIHVNFVDHKVGLRSTSGCVSLFADDMKELYSLISLDTPVYIINQPVKVALDQGSLYVESHKPMSEDITDFENEDQATQLILNQALKDQLPIDSKWDANEWLLDFVYATVGIPKKFEEV